MAGAGLAFCVVPPTQRRFSWGRGRALGAALGTIADRAPEIVLAIMVDFL
jgi:hypothetical protein